MTEQQRAADREPARVTVKILDREYAVTCPANERAELVESAEYLNKQMKEIRDGGRVIGVDRIAVMAALNMANDLLRARSKSTGSKDLGTRLKVLRERAEVALQRGQQLEL
jgi:cell division protein ZapA